jgi:hypothetical protein
VSRFVRWIALLLALGASSAARAQTSLSNGLLRAGGSKAVLSGLPSTNFQMGSSRSAPSPYPSPTLIPGGGGGGPPTHQEGEGR